LKINNIKFKNKEGNDEFELKEKEKRNKYEYIQFD
jgi:hypothetical protein